MASQEATTPKGIKPIQRNLRVARAAAQAAVAASRNTGRPVDPRVKELAESQSRP